MKEVYVGIISHDIYIYIYHIRPLCVGATPVPKGFDHMSNF